jgi:hypothetical protein
MGLEREEHSGSAARSGFGGVRTFRLIGLIGYAVTLLAGAELPSVAVGLWPSLLFSRSRTGTSSPVADYPESRRRCRCC